MFFFYINAFCDIKMIILKIVIISFIYNNGLSRHVFVRIAFDIDEQNMLWNINKILQGCFILARKNI